MGILKRRTVALGTAILLAWASMTGISAQSERAAETDIKAAFLYNFAKYIEWPAPTSMSAEFRVCAFGDASFISSLDTIIEGETIDGRPVRRFRPPSAEAARSCHILFVARSEMSRATDLITAVRGSPVLTVGDGPDFLQKGGMVSFVRDGNRVRFDVDTNVAQAAGLVLSSRLLRIARRVVTQEPGLP